MNTGTINNKILLVDDDPQDVKMILAALEESHLANNVNVVSDGAEALDYLYHRGKFQTRPDGNPILVLLDNKMAKVSGLQVLMTIKADGYLKLIPVVAFTSSRETKDILEFYKHGVNAYVVKPLDFHEFVKVIKLISIFWTGTCEAPPPSLGDENTQFQIDGNQTYDPRQREVIPW